MGGIPPADFGKLVNAQQMVGALTGKYTPGQMDNIMGQQANLRVDRMELNNNVKPTGQENRRYRQEEISECCVTPRKEGYGGWSGGRFAFDQEEHPSHVLVDCEMDRGARKEMSCRPVGTMSSDGCSSEGSLQTYRNDRTQQGGSFSSLLSGGNSAYSSLSASLNNDMSFLQTPSELITASTMMCSRLLLDCNPSPSPPSLPPQQLRPDSSGFSSEEMRRKKKNPLQDAFDHPDMVVWSDTKKFVVQWNKEGKLGFTIKNFKSRDGSEVYAMVTSLKGPSVRMSGLEIGDRVLSINGTPIHQQATAEVSASEVFKKQSRDSPVSIIIQRPKGARVRSVTNSEMSSLKTASRQGSISDTFSNDDRIMKRLPDLRLVIMGSNAEDIAEQLVGPKIWSRRQDGLISRKCSVKIQKNGSTFEYLSCRSHQIMDILNSINKPCHVGSNGVDGSSTTAECVVLEVVVVKDTMFADYCSQLVMSSNAMYIVGFESHSFLADTEKHMQELQRQLNKIRTYASSKSPVYLVSSWLYLPGTSDSVNNIGAQLHERFGEAFGGQLQYHKNCPCFMISRTSNQLPSSQSPSWNHCQHLDDRVDWMEEPDQVPSLSLKSSYSTCLSTCAPEACLNLKEHISRNIFEQGFLTRKSYPQKFLSYRAFVVGLRDQKQKCVLTSGIKRACKITDSEELTSLLEYLHNQGVIILSANEKEEPHHSFVALNPEELVHICQHLLEVPEMSRQDHSLRQHWNDLRTKSILSQTLLTHLLGVESDAACLTACLQQLNLIYDYSMLLPNGLSCDSPRTQRSSQQGLYLVPYHMSTLLPRGSASCRDLSSERVLLADFKGYRPHGLLSKLAIELGRIACKKGGTFKFLRESSWDFNMGGNYTVYLRDDPRSCMVKFITVCKVGFVLRNVLVDINSAILKVMKSDDRFVLGPPCPLHKKCMFQQELSGHTISHVIDLTKVSGERPLWCGNEDVLKFRDVREWIVAQGKEKQPSLDSSGMILSEDTPYSDLPSDLIQLVSSKMNLPTVRGRDWRGLAGQLGCTISMLKEFEAPHPHCYDPCGKLLDDWGMSKNATLGNLISHLGHPDLNRQDVIMEIKQKWKVVDSSTMTTPL
nr:uncharacterized protein LOC129257803 isoform X1 [Lytechinus pictus]